MLHRLAYKVMPPMKHVLCLITNKNSFVFPLCFSSVCLTRCKSQYSLFLPNLVSSAFSDVAKNVVKLDCRSLRGHFSNLYWMRKYDNNKKWSTWFHEQFDVTSQNPYETRVTVVEFANFRVFPHVAPVDVTSMELRLRHAYTLFPFSIDQNEEKRIEETVKKCTWCDMNEEWIHEWLAIVTREIFEQICWNGESKFQKVTFRFVFPKSE